MKRLFILLGVIFSIVFIGIYSGSKRQDRGDIYGRVEMIGSKLWSGNHLNGSYTQMVGVKTSNGVEYVTIGGVKDESLLLDKSNIGDSVKVSYKDIDYDNITIIK